MSSIRISLYVSSYEDTLFFYDPLFVGEGDGTDNYYMIFPGDLSRDQLLGILVGLADQSDPRYRPVGQKLHPSASFFGDVQEAFDEFVQETKYLVQLNSGHIVAVENIREFILGLEAFGEVAYALFKGIAGPNNTYSPRNWKNLLCVCVENFKGEIYEEMFLDGEELGDLVQKQKGIVTFEPSK